MTQRADEHSAPPADSRLSQAAFFIAAAAGVLAVLLVYELLAFGNDWAPGLIGRLPDGLSMIAVVAWLGLSVTGVVLGLVQLARTADVPWRAAGALGLGALSLLAVVVAVGAAMWEPAHPSDEEMMRSFREQKAQYEELLQLYETDRDLGMIDFGQSEWPGFSVRKGFPEARIERYRELMQELDVELLERRSGMTLFFVSRRGLGISGSSKCYVYATEPPSPLVENTQRNAEGPIGQVYRHIEGDWYLRYGWDT